MVTPSRRQGSEMQLFYTGIGSRKTPGPILSMMEDIAARFNQLGVYLRSGGAQGADSAFESKAGAFKEIYIPWDGFNDRKANEQTTIIPSITDKSRKLVEDFHPAPERLKRGAFSLMHRNGFQVLGENLDHPSACVVCYTPDGAFSGGTGQAMRIADSMNIPIFNLYHQDDQDILKKVLSI